ncbi:hypothetical protein PIB30_067773 [Stylosanthes scabra]|uniref:Uncharacterized protein n=1 Tax=Stylosanthes scabra TaxID=79078 RepID=A0ABU6ZLF0_9FABA|nr:hypothetical protein [Stylosanthes scabra]
MDSKIKEVALTRKGKEKIRTQPTRTSPRFASKQSPISLPSKIRTPPTRAFPRLAGLKALPPPSHEIPIFANPGTPKATKIRRTARISVKPIKRRFSQRIIAKEGSSTKASKEKVVIVLSSDHEIQKKVEEPAPELTVMNKDISEEEEDPEEESQEGETEAKNIHNLWGLADSESSSSEEEDIIRYDPHFWPYDGDLSDWRHDNPSDCSAGSCTGPLPANLKMNDRSPTSIGV